MCPNRGTPCLVAALVGRESAVSAWLRGRAWATSPRWPTASLAGWGLDTTPFAVARDSLPCVGRLTQLRRALPGDEAVSATSRPPAVGAGACSGTGPARWANVRRDRCADGGVGAAFVPCPQPSTTVSGVAGGASAEVPLRRRDGERGSFGPSAARCRGGSSWAAREGVARG